VLLALSIVGLFLLPSPWGYVAVAAALCVEVLELAFWKRFLRRYRVQTGTEALIGAPAEVVAACDPDGRVRFRGELWSARSEVPLAVGQQVRITGIEGLTLDVEPQASED
jgi:membrane-bound serine protease (ClpP class)